MFLDSTPCRVGRSVGPSVRPSVTLLNCERFFHYCSCPTIRDCPAVYPALLFYTFIFCLLLKNAIKLELEY